MGALCGARLGPRLDEGLEVHARGGDAIRSRPGRGSRCASAARGHQPRCAKILGTAPGSVMGADPPIQPLSRPQILAGAPNPPFSRRNGSPEPLAGHFSSRATRRPWLAGHFSGAVTAAALLAGHLSRRTPRTELRRRRPLAPRRSGGKMARHFSGQVTSRRVWPATRPNPSHRALAAAHQIAAEAVPPDGLAGHVGRPNRCGGALAGHRVSRTVRREQW